MCLARAVDGWRYPAKVHELRGGAAEEYTVTFQQLHDYKSGALQGLPNADLAIVLA